MARTGKHQGPPNARDIPPTPQLKDVTDADLKTIPPVKNQGPLPLLPAEADAKTAP
jgi:hypothetical protein